MKLETKRLIIRPIAFEDKNDIFEYRRDKEANKYQGWVPKTIADTEDFITKTAMKINQPHTWFQFVIIEKTTRKIIGDLGIHFFDNKTKEVEIGCTLDKAFQKNGYATETLKKMLAYLFNDLHKQRIIASIAPENKSSVRLFERIGFQKKTHHTKSSYTDRKWPDDLLYTITAKEWEKLNL